MLAKLNTFALVGIDATPSKPKWTYRPVYRKPCLWGHIDHFRKWKP